MFKRKLFEISSDFEFIIKKMFEELITQNNFQIVQTLNLETIIYIIKILKNNFLKPILINMIRMIFDLSIINNPDDLLIILSFVCYDENEILTNMIFLLNKYVKEYKIKCVVNECIGDARYNNSGLGTPTHCITHKKINMLKIQNNQKMKSIKYKCIYNCCDNQAKFNYPNEIKKIYCFTHKLINMVKI
jgi:hypothetical protein